MSSKLHPIAQEILDALTQSDDPHRNATAVALLGHLDRRIQILTTASEAALDLLHQEPAERDESRVIAVLEQVLIEGDGSPP